MRALAIPLALALSLSQISMAQAAGPVVTTPPSSVSLPQPVVPAPTPPSNTFNNDPHPMLPWGPGQIGGARYGPVIRYWEQQPQTVYGVVLVPIPQEEAKPEGEPPSQPSQPETPSQGALEARKRAEPQDVTVPGSLIVETTRGFIHMPRWVLQETGGGRHQWAWVGAWFQPK